MSGYTDVRFTGHDGGRENNDCGTCSGSRCEEGGDCRKIVTVDGEVVSSVQQARRRERGRRRRELLGFSIGHRPFFILFIIIKKNFFCRCK
jgi:hypothetical protein